MLEKLKISYDQNSIFRNLTRGGLSGFGIHAASKISKLILQASLASLFVPSIYGSYSYILNWIYGISIIALLGFDSVLIRYVASLSYEKKWSSLRKLLKLSYSTSIGLSLILLIFGAGVLFFIKGNFESIEIYYGFLFALLIIPFNAIIKLSQASLQGIKEVWKSKFPELVLLPSLTIIGIWGLYLIGLKELKLIIIVRLVALLCSAILVMYWLFKKLPVTRKESKDESDFNFKRLIQISLPFLLSSSVHMILSKIDIMMLGFFVEMKEVGIYTIYLQITTITSFGGAAVAIVAAPMISEAYQAQKKSDLKNIIAYTTLVATGFCVGSIVVFFLIGEWILGLINPIYSSALVALWILFLSQFINSILGMVGLLLQMTSNQNAHARIITFASILNIILNYVLIPPFGIIGAAMATSTSTIFWNVWMSIEVKKRLDVDYAPFIVINKLLKIIR